MIFIKSLGGGYETIEKKKTHVRVRYGRWHNKMDFSRGDDAIYALTCYIHSARIF